MMSDFTYEGTSRTLETEKGKLHYHEAGSGPALLLLHGSGPGVTGWANFKGNLSFFAPHFRTFILDLPGYGESDPVEGNPVMGAVEAVIRFLDGLGIDKVDIVGNSYGGMVGGFLAAFHGARVRRFVTIGGIGVNVTSTFPNEGISRLVEFVEDPTREKITAWLRSMVYDPAMVTEELIRERYEVATRPVTMATSRQLYSRAAIQAIADNMHGPDATQVFAHLPKIQVPTLITWGRDDKVSPLDGSLIPMRLIPNAELHVFPKCGHWAMIERKAEFESTVLAFLTRA